MEKIKINSAVFYQIERHSDADLSVAITIENKYVSNYIVAQALQEKLKKDYPKFTALQYSFQPELYGLLNKVKNSGAEPFPQVIILSLKKE